MNILVLTDKYSPDVGGLAVSTRRLAQGLTQAGHAVCVSLPASSVAPGAVTASKDADVTVYRLGPHRRADDTLADWFDHVAALHARHHLHLIHGMYIAQPAFVAVAAARHLGIPSVISARGNDLDRAAFDPGKFSQISWSLQNADAVTAVTTGLARKARAFAPGCNPRFIPNSVDATLFAPGPRDEALAVSLGLTGAPVIAFVGEARQKKGLTILLPAFARLCAQVGAPPGHRPILLLVGGVRQDDEPILDVFCRQNPALEVHAVPHVAHEKLPPYYRLADVLVIPSLRDGMPNSLLEAMACERAIAASDVGGMPDVLQGGVNGILVPPGDLNALADAMLTLSSDPSRRAELGRAARETVASEFAPAKEIERNLEIYQHVMRKT